MTILELFARAVERGFVREIAGPRPRPYTRRAKVSTPRPSGAKVVPIDPPIEGLRAGCAGFTPRSQESVDAMRAIAAAVHVYFAELPPEDQLPGEKDPDHFAADYSEPPTEEEPAEAPPDPPKNIPALLGAPAPRPLPIAPMQRPAPVLEPGLVFRKVALPARPPAVKYSSLEADPFKRDDAERQRWLAEQLARDGKRQRKPYKKYTRKKKAVPLDQAAAPVIFSTQGERSDQREEEVPDLRLRPA